LNWVGNIPGEGKPDPKSIIEFEKKRIVELFDKKKTILIPKVEKFEKSAISAQSQPTTENQQKQTGEGNFSTLNLSYKPTEFVRPKHYIVYSEKNRLEPKGKDYEATLYDLNFLKFENNFISVEELEKIISALENDINKGEMIPQERIREIILSVIPEKNQYVDKIYKVSYSPIFNNFSFLYNYKNFILINVKQSKFKIFYFLSFINLVLANKKRRL
jgi:hypothetical protein